MGSYPIWILILINLRHLVFGAALVGIFASIPRLTETTGRRTAAAVLLGVSVVIAVLLSPPAAQLQTLGGIPGLLLLVLGGAAAAAARLKPGIGLFFPVFAFASYLAGFVTLLLTGRPFALVFGECAAAFSAAAWGIAVAEEHREKEAKARLSQIESAARKDAESESKVISAAVAEAVQKERQRYIQDMHDGLGAELISTLSAVKNGNLPKEDIESALQSCLDQMRIAIDASGVSTEDFGTALANLRYRLAPRLKAAKLELKWNTLSLPDELSLPPQKAECALRMVQEALTNAIKYSQATRVEVAARTEDSRLLLSVTDNGVGFKPEEPAAASATGSGLGLKGMRRRIEECGGTLSIESPETGGASVRLSLPL